MVKPNRVSSQKEELTQREASQDKLKTTGISGLVTPSDYDNLPRVIAAVPLSPFNLVHLPNSSVVFTRKRIPRLTKSAQ